MGKEIGIDFGTTNTVVSYVDKKGRLRQLRHDGKHIIPSVIYFHSAHDYEIGADAKKLMENEKAKAGIDNFKPLIGDNSLRLDVFPENGAPFKIRPVKVAQLFLNKVVTGIENTLIKEFGPIDGCIDRAVITVPAKFSSTEKHCTKLAAYNAGLGMVKLAAEPTAAAIAWENDMDEGHSDNTVLVYDFGGGTFDVSIIQKKAGAFCEIATDGDKYLGGNRLTEKLMEEILVRINDEFGMELPLSEDDFDEDYHRIDLEKFQRNIMEIRKVANQMKEDLSASDNVTGLLNLFLPEEKRDSYTIVFDREELENIIGQEIERTVKITERVIRAAAKKDVEQIDQVVLAGGSSNIPFVKNRLETGLGKLDIVYSDDVSTLISRGAAVLAKNDSTLENMTQTITNVEMGIAAREGISYGKFQMIIPADEPLPCTRRRRFNLGQDDRRRLEIKYYERDVKNYPNAERIDDEGIIEIDALVVNDLPPGLKADETFVEVEFTARKDGSLDIHAILVDADGKQIHQDSMTYRKLSDLE